MDVRFGDGCDSDPDVTRGVLVLRQNLEVGPLFWVFSRCVIYFLLVKGNYQCRR
jgi:hypothetical protein